MTKWLWILWLLVLAITSVGQEVRDHRDTPGALAQWTVGGDLVDSLSFKRLYNTARAKHLTAGSSGDLFWDTISPGNGTVIFENCTRPGETVYGSDKVAIRFGSRFLIATGPAGRDWAGDRESGCQFRLIPSSAGFVPAGYRGGTFAIYNMQNNRYLINSPFLIWNSLIWQEKRDGPPRGTLAGADFVPVDLSFVTGTIGDKKYTIPYLTIKNIGNVPSSASQQEMKVTIRGQQVDFLVIRPVAPGAILRNPIRLNGTLSHCEVVPVELDTNSRLKFQIGPGGLPNDSIFANDRKTLYARHLNRPRNHTAELPCGRVLL